MMKKMEQKMKQLNYTKDDTENDLDDLEDYTEDDKEANTIDKIYYK